MDSPANHQTPTPHIRSTLCLFTVSNLTLFLHLTPRQTPFPHQLPHLTSPLPLHLSLPPRTGNSKQAARCSRARLQAPPRSGSVLVHHARSRGALVVRLSWHSLRFTFRARWWGFQNGRSKGTCCAATRKTGTERCPKIVPPVRSLPGGLLCPRYSST